MTTGAPTTSKPWLELGLRSLLMGSIGLLLTFLLAWEVPLIGQISLSAGDVAPVDVVSPRQITYESEVLTQVAKERAMLSVPDYYEPPQGRVRRQQVSRSREILQFISVVRADAYASEAEKQDYIAAVPDLNLTEETIEYIITLPNVTWQAIEQEVPLALDRGMREEIRESSLAAVRNRAAVLISSDLDEESGNISVEIVRSLIQPNSFLNPDRTAADRDMAMSAIPMQTNTLERGETILRAGDIATPEEVEALKKLGLQQTSWDWWRAIQAGFFSLALLVVTAGAIYRLYPQMLRQSRILALPLALSALWLVAAKFMVIPHNMIPYIYPLAALGMLIAVLVDMRVAVVMILGFSLVLGYLAGNNIGLIVYLTLGTLVGAVILGRAERLTAFLWAGLAITVSNLVIANLFILTVDDFSSSQLLQSLVSSGLNGGLSASIALIGYFVMGNLFDITTSLQLTELSRPTHPLLRQLLLKAPGTYHHTILVSNLAERAAEAIGADAFLVRVGAYYHDIGKTVRPYFFVDNIDDGKSPHGKLDPVTSAQIIISHVTDGIDLGQKYHLPARIIDFISEHHGSQMVRYFYIQACNQAQDDDTEAPNPEDYCYPGPNPRSKETAILLLADTCEAAVRAERPASREALVTFLDKLFTDRVLEGALSNSDLTFKELETVKQTFLHILQGVHHPRIRYPERRSPSDVGKGDGAREEGGEGESGDAGADQISPPTVGWGNPVTRRTQPGSETPPLSFTGLSGSYRSGEI